MTAGLTELLQQEAPLTDEQVLWMKTVIDHNKASMGLLNDENTAIKRRVTLELFPNPKEGTNKAERPGFICSYAHKLNRYVDVATLDAAITELNIHRGETGEVPLTIDYLFKYSAKLKVTPYKTLTAEERIIIDQALNIKAAAPDPKIFPKASAEEIREDRGRF